MSGANGIKVRPLEKQRSLRRSASSGKKQSPQKNEGSSLGAVLAKKVGGPLITHMSLTESLPRPAGLQG